MNNRLLMGLLLNARARLPKYKQRSTINRTIMGDFLGVGSTMAEDLCRKCGADPYAHSADWSQMKPDAGPMTAEQIESAAFSELRSALSEYEKLRDHIGGCMDGGCLVQRPTGMHTNGGCRCHQDRIKSQHMMRSGQRLHERIASVLNHATRSE